MVSDPKRIQKKPESEHSLSGFFSAQPRAESA
jgi:hypothetical protein